MIKDIKVIKILDMKYPNEHSKTKRRYWLVECPKCNKEFEATAQHIVSGRTKACYDCRLVTHGDSNGRLYKIWGGMKQRVSNQSNPAYLHYGGRGISICKEWNNSYSTFKDWSLDNGYDDTLSIDRINNDGNYGPSNCRWTTQDVQTQNTRLLKVNNSSGFRGVSWHKKGGKWQVKITINYKINYLGLFDTAQEGARVYDRYVIDNDLVHPLNFTDYRDVIVDADSILYLVTNVPKNKVTLTGKSIGNKASNITHKQLKRAFMDKIYEYVAIAEIESVFHDWHAGKTIICISDKTNFRYQLYPEYKANRKGKVYSDQFLKLRKWARKKFAPKIGLGLEADDYVAMYAKHGGVVFSIDKDVLNLEGLSYDLYHNVWVNTTKKESDRQFLIQKVMGDSVDNITGIKGVGKVTATKLLDKHGWSWQGIVAIYNEYGLTEDDAKLTEALVTIDN